MSTNLLYLYSNLHTMIQFNPLSDYDSVTFEEMAFRPTLANSWKSMLVGARIEARRSFVSSTTPAVDAAQSHASSSSSSRRDPMSEYMKGELAPIYMVMGMVVVALAIGTHTAKQQLLHSPVVNVTKKKRESVPEVEDPDTVISSADKFVNQSFLRKVAHIQDDKKTLHDPVHPDPFTRPRTAETLKTVGVEPSRR